MFKKYDLDSDAMRGLSERDKLTLGKVNDGMAQEAVFDNGHVVGVVLYGGEKVLWESYPQHSVTYKVAVTIAFATESVWWANVPLAREVIRVVGGVR